MLTDVDGYYLFTNVTPNYCAGETYSLRFSAPGAGATTALLGETDSDFTDGQQRIDDIDVQEGSNLLALNMPVDPNGVVYDSVARTPVAGAIVSLLDARNGCRAEQLLRRPEPAGPGHGRQRLLQVRHQLLRPVVPGPAELPDRRDRAERGVCPGRFRDDSADVRPVDAAVRCAVVSGLGERRRAGDDAALRGAAVRVRTAATVPARSAGTNYHLFLRLDGSQSPGSSQLFNNHIPLDPRLDGAVAVTKTTPMLNVIRGELIPYIITVSNSFGADLLDVNIVDRFPAGFRYVEGSARFDGVPTEPALVRP